MSLTGTHSLANQAWAKLSLEAARPQQKLRILVGHANLLNLLTEEPQRTGAFIEEPEEDWHAGNSDTSSSSDSDSDYCGDEGDQGIGVAFEGPLWLKRRAPDFSKYARSQQHNLWLREWLLPPMKVPPDDTQCDLCRGGWCRCISLELPENKPEITEEGSKGQSVRVIGVEGEIVYQQGQILGELLGELVQLDSYDELRNWVKEVNHSCEPSAEFRIMKISGWWRQMLVAIQNIPHNGEVTAPCGEGLPRGGNECHCEHCAGHM